ncbi:hypothetical protein C8Q77DRAFT_1050484 [Trametes polyzona]|nr:hypothetical protein C8Q77DRAFT_1050484 [Trametes polyzona]
MLWDVAGENNAGKTQFALQLSLTVQLPQRLGGISGATCYISTREDLLTPRIEGILTNHPLLAPDLCGLPDIHTVKARFFVAVEKVLTDSLPAIVDERSKTPGAKPVKLIVIDTLTDIFDEAMDERYEDKIFRARHLKQMGLLLHQAATKYGLAIVLLSSTSQTRPRIDGADRAPGELRFSDQARWFCRAHTLAGEDANEAILGHVWPNQLNARIMMSRTIRTRLRSALLPCGQDGPSQKRRKVENGRAAAEDDVSVPFRRFTVIFSSAGPPGYCDYVIADEGVVGFAPEEPPPSTFIYPSPANTPPPSSSPAPSSELPSQTGPLRAPNSSLPSTHASTSSSNGVQQQLRYRQSLSYAGSSSSSRSTPVTNPPPSQSIVPSSQPDLDEDWDVYWKDTQDDDHLYASVEDRMEGVDPAGVVAAGPIEAAEEGPPVEKDTDSDHYWDGGDDDALYTDL